jgi:hypothetical protein
VSKFSIQFPSESLALCGFGRANGSKKEVRAKAAKLAKLTDVKEEEIAKMNPPLRFFAVLAILARNSFSILMRLPWRLCAFA